MTAHPQALAGGDDVARPNFLYLGPDKAGSSWLHEVLLRHEQVFLPEAKDLYFFDRYWDRGLPWYLGHFGGAGPQHAVVGEVCQDYLFHDAAPERIAQALGSPRLMVTLRDPAERAFSSWLYALKQGAVDWGATFAEGLQVRPELLGHGRYATHLARYVERFGRDRLHVSVFDDLVDDPQRFVDGVLAFLEVAPAALPEDLLEARLPAARARSALLARTARRAADLVRERDPVGGGADLIGRVKRSPLVQRALYRPLGEDRPTMTPGERDGVHRALGGEVAELDRRFGLDLARRWGWQDVVPSTGRAEGAA